MPSIIVHAGAWDIRPDRTEAHRAGCLRVFLEGWNVLKNRVRRKVRLKKPSKLSRRILGEMGESVVAV